MRKLILLFFVLCSAVAYAQLFPDNPVPIRDGYGKGGAGTHNAYPSGVPGGDCVVNPVSLKSRVYNEELLFEDSVVTFKERDVIDMPADALFDFDQSVLREEGEVLLADFANVLIELDVLEITITGHTDSKGSISYNYILGYDRAAAVSAKLMEEGYMGFVNIESGSELYPLALNQFEDGSDNPEGRQQNRRVQLVIDRMELEEVETIVTRTETVQRIGPRNPQIFHVLGSAHRVHCGGANIWVLDAARIFN